MLEAKTVIHVQVIHSATYVQIENAPLVPAMTHVMLPHVAAMPPIVAMFVHVIPDMVERILTKYASYVTLTVQVVIRGQLGRMRIV